MANRWEFRRVRQKESSYRDGTIVPHLDLDVIFNGTKVGYINLHMHKVKVDRGEFDHSVGITVRLNANTPLALPPAAGVLPPDGVLLSPPSEDTSRLPSNSARARLPLVAGRIIQILAITKKTDRSRRS